MKFKNDQNAYGDVARDILQDTAINRRWSYRAFTRHLMMRNASQRVFEIVDDLNYQYKEMRVLGFSV